MASEFPEHSVEEKNEDDLFDEQIPKGKTLCEADEDPDQQQKTPGGPSQERAAGDMRSAPKKRKEHEKVDLSTVFQCSPGRSRNRQNLKEMVAERKKIAKEQNAATKRIKVETQRQKQKRLIDKASRLSNEELLEVFRQRQENQEVRSSRGKAEAKATAKAKAAAM